MTLTRVGASAPLTFQLTRDEIPNASIDLSYEIRPGIGYIHIKQFQETTGREFDDAVDAFGPNLKGLVLDLRGKSGWRSGGSGCGMRPAAEARADYCFAAGPGVSGAGVSRDARQRRAELPHRGAGESRNGVGGGDCVGALQDHDRALIAGETTFGKGLVQTVYTLSDNTGLALTTYHYFTPSGRLIQRNYDGVSLYDYYYNHDQRRRI